MNVLPSQDRLPLLTGFDLTDIQDLTDENPYLRGFLQGYLGELQLRRSLLLCPEVSDVEKIQDISSRKGDLLVTYRGEQFSIEVKSLSTSILREDPLNQSWEASVVCKNTDRRTVYVDGLGEIQSVNLMKGQFDILAICTFPVTGLWEFLFIENTYLPEPDAKPGFIKSRFTINTSTTPGLHHDPEIVLASVLAKKAAGG